MDQDKAAFFKWKDVTITYKTHPGMEYLNLKYGFALFGEEVFNIYQDKEGYWIVSFKTTIPSNLLHGHAKFDTEKFMFVVTDLETGAVLFTDI